ncbi:hypothetical protein ScPMuIL_017935 [Solemya velum]
MDVTHQINTHTPHARTRTHTHRYEHATNTIEAESIELEDYNDNVRPYCETNDTTTLTLDVALRQILDLDEPNQLIKLSLWIRMSWSDCRLTWNPSDYDGLESFVSKADRIWIPDLALYDSMEQEIAQIEGSNAKISSDGKVQFNFPATTEIRCKVDVKLFPFDRQACPLKFESGEKVSVGVTILLALTVFLLLLGDTLPPYSDSVPLIAIYFDFVIFLVCFSCLISVLVLHFFFKPNTPIPDWSRTVFLKYMAKILFVEAKRPEGQKTYERVEEKVVRRTTVRLASFMQKITPILRLHREKRVAPQVANPQAPGGRGKAVWGGGRGKAVWGIPVSELAEAATAVDTPPDAYSYQQPEDNINEETVVTEWQILANVIDRLGLVIHTLAIFLSSFIVLLSLDLN